MTAMKLTRRAALALAAASIAVLPATFVQAQEKTIRILRSPVGTFQGLYIGQDQGYFKEKGIALDVKVGGTAPQNIAQVQAGQADIVMTGSFEVVSAAAQGLPVVAVLNTQDQGDVGTTGLLVPPGSAIKSVKDLKGKKIGMPGIQSAQGLALFRALEKEGMSKDDVTLVNLPFDAMIESAEKGNVDAIIPIGLFFSLAQSKGFTDVPAVYAEIKGTPAVIFLASKEWLAANADTAKAFTEAMVKAYDYANKNPDAVRAVDSAQTKMPPEYIAKRYIAPMVGAFQREKWAAAVADMAKFGFIPKAPAEADYIWDGAPK